MTSDASQMHTALPIEDEDLTPERFAGHVRFMSENLGETLTAYTLGTRSLRSVPMWRSGRLDGWMDVRIKAAVAVWAFRQLAAEENSSSGDDVARALFMGQTIHIDGEESALSIVETIRIGKYDKVRAFVQHYIENHGDPMGW